jgi:uncharacterized protein DUF6069
VTTSDTPQQSRQPAIGPRRSQRLDGRKLWAGGTATAIVAALIALVGVLIARGIFHVAVLSSNLSGTWGNANTAGYVLLAFGAGLVATLLIQALLLSSTPEPYTFFGWIMALVTVAMTVAPFAAGGGMAPQFATAAINLAIGIAVWSLTLGVARRSWDSGL